MRKDRKNLKKKRGLTPWNIRTHCKMVTKILWYLIQTKRGCRGLRQKRTCLRCGRSRFNPWVGKIPWRRVWQSTPVFLPGEFHGQRSLVSYSPWGWKESDTTEWLTLTKTLSVLVQQLRDFIKDPGFFSPSVLPYFHIVFPFVFWW